MNGHMIQIEKLGHNIRMTFTEEGLKEAREIVERDGIEGLGSDDMMWEFLEHNTCNGWVQVRPEQVGALTDMPLISDDFIHDEDGGFEEIGMVYAFTAIDRISPLVEMLKKGHCTWIGVGKCKSRIKLYVK